MKKLFLASLIAASAFAAELYSDKVISLYLSPNDAKPAGKLLPTNAFSAKCKEQICELVIKGYYNQKAPALYFSTKNRILVAAFSKKAAVKFIPLSKADASGFMLSSVVAYAKKSDLENASNKLDALFTKAKNLFSENCGTCHALHDTKEFNANQWPGNFKAMQSRAAIEKEDAWLVIEYLQKHAKDMK